MKRKFNNSILISGTKYSVIIDSPYVAMMASLFISHLVEANKNAQISIIYESKIGIDDEKDHIPVSRIILGVGEFYPSTVISVPSPYFLVKDNDTTLNKVICIKKFVGKVKAAFIQDKNTIYVGPSTSSLMKIIGRSNKFQLDHGTGDYLKRLKEKENKWNYDSIMKSLVGNIMRFGLNYDSSTASYGATMCGLNDDSYYRYDYREYNIPPDIEDLLLPVADFAFSKARSYSLVMPVSPHHSVCGFIRSSSDFDILNIEMIKRGCSPNEMVLIKYHPSFYYNKENSSVGLLKMLEDEGFCACDIDNFLPDDCKGMIPAEIIVKKIGISKIIAEQSSLIYNVSCNENISLISSAKLLDAPLKRNKVVLNYTERLNSSISRKVTIV